MNSKMIITWSKLKEVQAEITTIKKDLKIIEIIKTIEMIITKIIKTNKEWVSSKKEIIESNLKENIIEIIIISKINYY